MTRRKAISSKKFPLKRAYGVIAFVLLIAFAGRVSVICVNGGLGVSKYQQQVLAEDNHEQNDKQEENKLDSK